MIGQPRVIPQMTWVQRVRQRVEREMAETLRRAGLIPPPGGFQVDGVYVSGQVVWFGFGFLTCLVLVSILIWIIIRRQNQKKRNARAKVVGKTTPK